VDLGAGSGQIIGDLGRRVYPCPFLFMKNIILFVII